MNSLSLDIPSSNKPFYLRLAQAIIQSIIKKQVLEGERLPTARALSTQLQVNRHTIMRSYAELVAQGWVENLERSHYRVSEHLPILSSASALAPIETEKSDMYFWSIAKEIPDSNFIKSTANFKYNFAGGKPDTALFPFDEYRMHISDSLKKPKVQCLHYGDNQGDPELIKQGLIYLRRTRNLHCKELIITNGSQEALYIVSQLLLKPGDKVAVEPLGYPPAWLAFQSAGAQLVSIKQDEQGLSTEHLREMARTEQLKCIYLTPLHQYPTTVTLSPLRRLEIYNIAKEFQLFIIEDDYDHEFHYACQPLAPIAANDPAALVIYLTSFSKIMFPAARTGMLAVPKQLLKPLINFRTTINHKPAFILQDALARWIVSGGFERHIRRCTKAYQQRYTNALAQLERANSLGAMMQCVAPDGGMALWIATHVNTVDLAQKLANINIYIQHQNEFCLASHTGANKLVARYFRLGFAGQPIDQFNSGFNAIIDLVLELQCQKKPEHSS